MIDSFFTNYKILNTNYNYQLTNFNYVTIFGRHQLQDTRYQTFNRLILFWHLAIWQFANSNTLANTKTIFSFTASLLLLRHCNWTLDYCKIFADQTTKPPPRQVGFIQKLLSATSMWPATCWHVPFDWVRLSLKHSTHIRIWIVLC